MPGKTVIDPLQERFNKLLAGKFSLLRDRNVYLAISGGRDSVCLLHLLLNAGIRPVLLHCNFQMRGTESDEDEKFVLNFRSSLELEVKTIRFDTYGEMSVSHQGLQQTARALRYNWFETITHEQDYVFTAHHLDDSIETFFINLLRGTGIRGLSGIPEIRGRYMRPMLDFSSEEIAAYMVRNQILFRVDSSNASDKYLRNKIRRDLIPELKELQPGFHSDMAGLFDDIRNLISLGNSTAEEFRKLHFSMTSEGIVIEIKSLLLIDSSFLIESVFKEFGIRRNNINQFLDIIGGEHGKKMYCAGNEFIRNRAQLIIRKKTTNLASSHIINNLPWRSQSKPDFVIEYSASCSLPKHQGRLRLDAASCRFPLTLRNWQKGDRFRPLGMTGTKLVSDFLTDRKVNTAGRIGILVLIDSTGEILAIPGLEISEKAKLTPTSELAIEITTEQNEFSIPLPPLVRGVAQSG